MVYKIISEMLLLGVVFFLLVFFLLTMFVPSVKALFGKVADFMKNMISFVVERATFGLIKT